MGHHDHLLQPMAGTLYLGAGGGYRVARRLGWLYPIVTHHVHRCQSVHIGSLIRATSAIDGAGVYLWSNRISTEPIPIPLLVKRQPRLLSRYRVSVLTWGAAAFALAFFAAGFHELAAGIQWLILAFLLWRVPTLRRVTWGAFIGASIGLILELIAPGNTIRLAAVAHYPPSYAVAGTLVSMVIYPVQASWNALLAVGLLIVVGYHLPRLMRPRWYYLVGLWLLMGVFVLPPALYGLGDAARVFVLPSVLLVLMWVYVGYGIRWDTKRLRF